MSPKLGWSILLPLLVLCQNSYAETWECKVVQDPRQRYENDYSNSTSHTFTRISASEYVHVFQDWVFDEDYNLVPDSTKKTRNLEVAKEEVAIAVSLIDPDLFAYDFVKLNFTGKDGPRVTMSNHDNDFPIGLGGVCKLICSSEDIRRWSGVDDACGYNNPFQKK